MSKIVAASRTKYIALFRNFKNFRQDDTGIFWNVARIFEKHLLSSFRQIRKVRGSYRKIFCCFLGTASGVCVCVCDGGGGIFAKIWTEGF
jgi:hypothetical protein